MNEPTVAYVSMEIAVATNVATYSGGLGVLAGDVVRAAADAAYPMAGVTLLYREGYFRQSLDASGEQHEEPQPWRLEDALEPLAPVVTIPISGRDVAVGAWRFRVHGVDGSVPVYFLDTDRPENDEAARGLTRALYGGDARYRLEQETLLGLGTVAMLRALGHDAIATYHMNEGHSALLVLALLDRLRANAHGMPAHDDLARVRERCVFTTHTPVPAGHDRFDAALAHEVLGSDRLATLRALDLIEGDTLNMTHLAMRASRFTNAVAMKHGEVSRAMFPGAEIHAITNGVHAGTWTAPPFQDLFDRRLPGWRRDNWQLRQAAGIPLEEIATAHVSAKHALIERIAHASGKLLDPNRFTIGIARRATAYKRNDLILYDPDRLAAIARRFGGIQLVFGGKAHPRDWDGKAMIRHIVGTAHALSGDVEIVYVENYDMSWGASLTSGADLWLNTPRPPNEASGTSGMKAAMNAVPSLSVMDGWWIEGALDGITGWSIDAETGTDDARTADALYNLLETTILPGYTHTRDQYLTTMRGAIAFNASHFNAQRMLAQYAIEAYAPPPATETSSAEHRLGGIRRRQRGHSPQYDVPRRSRNEICEQPASRRAVLRASPGGGLRQQSPRAPDTEDITADRSPSSAIRMNAAELRATCSALSEPRLTAYLETADGNRRRALALYAWNARMSAALLVPLHICEIVVRNAILDVIERVYGTSWYSAGSALEASLPRPTTGYSPFHDLVSARKRHTGTAVIPELKLMFWSRC